MATMLNILPVEPKQNAVQVKGSKPGSLQSKGQPVIGFSKILTNEADKKELDDAAGGKEDAAAQLMAAMAGIMNFPVTKEFMDEGGQADIVPATAIKAELPESNLMEDTPQDLNLLTALKVSSGQLKTALSQITGAQEVFKPVGIPDNAIVEPAAVSPGPVQGQPVNRQENSKIDLVLPSIIVDTSLQEASQLADTMPSMILDGTGKMEKGSSKQQVDAKRIFANSSNNPAIVEKNPDEGVAQELKIVTAPQKAANVSESVVQNSNMDQLVLQAKEQTKSASASPEPAVNHADGFNNVLSQQVLKQEHPVMASEPKTVQQPVRDPYHVTAQIVDQARLIEGQKNTEMVIRLKPEHLGELTFKVTVENGVVSASFHSNSTEVRNILEGSLMQLKQDLASQGLKVENVGIYAGLGEFFSNGQRESQRKPEVKVQNKKIEDDFLEALESNDPPAAAGDAAGVDYRV